MLQKEEKNMFGLLFICCATLLTAASSSPATLNNSSLSLVLADQCVTREEVREEIQVQTNHLESQIQCATREEVQADIQTQTNHLETQIQCATREVWNNIQNQTNHLESQIQPLTRELQDVQAEIQQLQEQIQLLRNDIQTTSTQLVGLLTPGSLQNPAQSCKDIIQGSPSNFYWIQNIKTGIPTWQYCAMNRTCCGQTGGWMQVVNLDMTDANQNCPHGFRLITSPRRMCGRYNIGCVSAVFPVHGVKYSRVCGRVIGYQYATPDAFWQYHVNRALSIDHAYVDGVSITRGSSPRKHIWTFAAALNEQKSNFHRCPCTNTQYHTKFSGTIPPFIGNDYFCETASRTGWIYQYSTADPLWNGQGCGSVSTCCSFNNPPWFCKQLTQPTRDDIEVRLCGDQNTSNEDTPIEIIEIYVQ